MSTTKRPFLIINRAVYNGRQLISQLYSKGANVATYFCISVGCLPRMITREPFADFM